MLSDYSGLSVHGEYKVNVEGNRQVINKYVVQTRDNFVVK